MASTIPMPRKDKFLITSFQNCYLYMLIVFKLKKQNKLVLGILQTIYMLCRSSSINLVNETSL